jgi:hypothetical protein
MDHDLFHNLSFLDHGVLQLSSTIRGIADYVDDVYLLPLLVLTNSSKSNQIELSQLNIILIDNFEKILRSLM